MSYPPFGQPNSEMQRSSPLGAEGSRGVSPKAGPRSEAEVFGVRSETQGSDLCVHHHVLPAAPVLPMHYTTNARPRVAERIARLAHAHASPFRLCFCLWSTHLAHSKQGSHGSAKRAKGSAFCPKSGLDPSKDGWSPINPPPRSEEHMVCKAQGPEATSAKPVMRSTKAKPQNDRQYDARRRMQTP